MAQEPDLLVNEPRKTLYPVQNGFNFELNSWSPGRWFVSFSSRKLIGSLGVSYSFLPRRSGPKSPRPVSADQGKVKGRVADWDRRRSEPVFRSQSAAQIVRKGTQSAGLPLTGSVKMVSVSGHAMHASGIGYLPRSLPRSPTNSAMEPRMPQVVCPALVGALPL